MDASLERLQEVLDRLRRIEEAVSFLVQQRTVKDWYSTAEAAAILGKAEFTVREWCRLGRVHAQKRQSGRGSFPAWVISHAEVQRIQREGLVALSPCASHPCKLACLQQRRGDDEGHINIRG